MLNPKTIFGYTPRVNIPPEFEDTAKLLLYLGMSKSELKKIWFYRERMYHNFNVSGAKETKRLISAPDHRLKMLQRKIAASLDTLYCPRKSVHGFVRHRSVKTNAASHLSAKYLLNLDLSDFFGSISENRVNGLFVSLGIDKEVALILARLSCYKNHLPQGAPTSPVISNMICFRLDKELLSIAKQNRCIYTRYADDITFSSYKPLTVLFDGVTPNTGKCDIKLLGGRLLTTFQNNGLIINPEKMYYADKSARQTVTGLRVNELVNVDRKYVRNVRSALHVVEKSGVLEAQRVLKDKYLRNSTIEAHLQGKIAWLGHVKGRSDPVFRKLAAKYNNLFPKKAIKLEPTKEEVRNRAVWIVEYSDHENYSQGSAFFLKGVGLVTAWHCVNGHESYDLYHPSKPSNKFTVTVSRSCKSRDLALLNHNIPFTEFYELSLPDRTFHVGESLYAAGYPGFGPGDKLNVRLGAISSFPIKFGIQMVEVTQKLPSGMSGGPLVDSANRVAGIIHKGGEDEPRDFAVHIDVLKAWVSLP